MSNPEDYIVGWICAITTEYIAAQVFLDEKHDGPECVSPNDNNDYTLGRIGKHNTVIAVLPDGEYGTSSAARVASRMLLSFPNVRIGLMVGIGGGAPSRKHDIRLGDVVVSARRSDSKEGSVFQYDFGKTVQGQGFQTTAFLNQPPEILRTAMSGLRADYQIDGHHLEEAVNSVLEKKRRLMKEFKRPDSESDRLYKSTIVHSADNDAKCIDNCGDDPSQLISRPKREEDNTVVHYGMIASANQLMKDASLRDMIGAEKDVLCFEMEAAGLMNHFPCLVIRGICDYSDSHKNKEWQGYAAMVASAYAKDLLLRIAPNRVEAQRKIVEIVSSVEKDVKKMLMTSEDTSNAVKVLEFEQRREKIERWLSSPDPSTNHHAALQKHQEGTGLWFLESDQFLKWKTRENSFLWLYGIPGCGKTVLSSVVIKHLTVATSPSQPLLYFYFDFTDKGKQSLENMIRSLIKQLYAAGGGTRSHLDELFKTCKESNRQPCLEELTKCIIHMMQAVCKVWVILDALDECDARNGSLTLDLLPWLENLQNSTSNVHLLVTSRPEEDIRAGISKYAVINEMIQIKPEAITVDIRAYVQKRIMEDERLKRWWKYKEVQVEIETRLMEKSNGMFRWAALQLDALGKCLDHQELADALDSLPDTLDQAYSRILKAIDPRRKKKAIRILQFLAFSKRPLQLEELVDAIVVDLDCRPSFNAQNRMPDIEEISIYCSSLVTISSRTVRQSVYSQSSNRFKDRMYEFKVLQLSHLSVKDYLISNRLDKDIAADFQEVAAKASMATVCLAYLLHLNPDIKLENISRMYPFVRYSASYWMSYAVVAEGKDERLQGLIEDLLCRHPESYQMCYRLYPAERPLNENMQPVPALYYACLGGLLNTVRCIISQGADVNERGGVYGSALGVAVAQGHVKLVELLVKAGADVNVQGKLIGSPVVIATIQGHGEIVELLIKAGADVNAREVCGSALNAASAQGHVKIAELLVKAGADVNAQGGLWNGSALAQASNRGFIGIVKLLLNAGADVNARDHKDSSTALCVASRTGHKKIVKLLLNAGANVNVQYSSKSCDPRSALQDASDNGHKEIVELLVKAGARL